MASGKKRTSLFGDGKRQHDYPAGGVCDSPLPQIFTIDEVVFTEPGDLILLGAHSGEMEPYDASLEKHLLPGGIFRTLDVFTETTKAFLHGDV